MCGEIFLDGQWSSFKAFGCFFTCVLLLLFLMVMFVLLFGSNGAKARIRLCFRHFYIGYYQRIYFNKSKISINGTIN